MHIIIGALAYTAIGTVISYGLITFVPDLSFTSSKILGAIWPLTLTVAIVGFVFYLVLLFANAFQELANLLGFK